MTGITEITRITKQQRAELRDMLNILHDKHDISWYAMAGMFEVKSKSTIYTWLNGGGCKPETFKIISNKFSAISLMNQQTEGNGD